MISFVIRILGNIVALWLAAQLVSGFGVNGTWLHYLVAALVLAILNITVRPALKFISFPIILLTLGLFTFVINAIILWLLSAIIAFVSIEGIIALVLATIIVSIVNVFFSLVAKIA